MAKSFSKYHSSDPEIVLKLKSVTFLKLAIRLLHQLNSRLIFIIFANYIAYVSPKKLISLKKSNAFKFFMSNTVCSQSKCNIFFFFFFFYKTLQGND